jgi:hypothetical protein
VATQPLLKRIIDPLMNSWYLVMVIAATARHEYWLGRFGVANLATCGICEQTSASCKGPASRNDIALILSTKGILQDGAAMYYGPGIVRVAELSVCDRGPGVPTEELEAILRPFYRVDNLRQSKTWALA